LEIGKRGQGKSAKIRKYTKAPISTFGAKKGIGERRGSVAIASTNETRRDQTGPSSRFEKKKGGEERKEKAS